LWTEGWWRFDCYLLDGQGIIVFKNKKMPNLYIIAGCNGAGKTTASYAVLPDLLQCREFVNADEIAKGLSPFQPEKVAIQAGRLMLQRLDELLQRGDDFAFETTLASRTFVHTIRTAQQAGYSVTLLFFWLNSPELAVQRVAQRVRNGGHHIAEAVILRRYQAGIRNFFDLYQPLCDAWLLVNNSQEPFYLVAESTIKATPIIYNAKDWNTLSSLAKIQNNGQ
jgi:predicted ABC-type ATPase